MIQEYIQEALETRKFQPGQVKFSKSTFTDPHIVKIMAAVAAAYGVPVEAIKAQIEQELAQFQGAVDKAPILYATIKENLVEDQLFTLMMKAPKPVKTEAPTFKERTFFKLVRSIAAEHDEFWPLRSFIDGRRLQPKFEFDTPGVDTAAASPNGVFMFSIKFMQDLLDYAELKGLHPKGKKYVANGGDIPNGYAYIEFLILHEFMHYTNDDFHYQKVIPNADPKIINWVGDFRSNYLLVKSGYDQLPMGLFNDNVNYDRQKTYAEMYDIVKREFDALKEDNEDLAKKMSDALDKLGDDHEPGQSEGAKEPTDMKPEDIDKAGEATAGKMEEGEDLSPEERAKKEAAGKAGEGKANGDPGKGAGRGNSGIDYTKIRPTFNWKSLITKLINTATIQTQETYSKPSRRSVSSLDIARQVGAAAMKPGEKPEDFAEIKIAFVIDSSGSMGGVIAKVMANAINLLKQPKFKNSESIVIKFSGDHDIFRVNFNKNIATKVADVVTKPKAYNLTVNDVFGVHFGAGTVFGAPLKGDLQTLLAKGWNILVFSDTDILMGENYTNYIDLIKSHPKQMFTIFDSDKSYAEFRKKAGMSTPNITYFQ